MLVLLIIFLITIPAIMQNVPVELPKERNIATQTKPENIVISVNKDGDIFWNQQLMADTDAAFREAQGRGGQDTAARSAYSRRRECAL